MPNSSVMGVEMTDMFTCDREGEWQEWDDEGVPCAVINLNNRPRVSRSRVQTRKASHLIRLAGLQQYRYFD